MKKTILTAIAISALLALLLAGMHFEVAEANFTPLPNLPTPIYVRGDGAIEGGAGAIQRIENTYTFIRNINETIEIQKDNIISTETVSISQNPLKSIQKDSWLR